MLDRVDRMLLAVKDRERATETFVRLFGARFEREVPSTALVAQRSILRLGESELELCQPTGPGPAQSHLDRWGEGLIAAGYASTRLPALLDRLVAQRVAFERDGDQAFLPATSTFGFPMMLSAWTEKERVGPVSFIYEATNALETDWRVVSARYSEIFGLDASRFSEIGSERFGYAGTLTLFNPPARLDRIELSQTFAGKGGAMRRFVERRGGDGLYMCYLETDRFDELKDRLLAGGAVLTPRGPDIAHERDNVWVHPKSLHGMLLGISRETFAWDWSGRPELIQPAKALG
jgi:hypothetical protein